MLFFNNIRFQIAAAAVLIIIIFDYLRNPHLKLMSTNAFRAMLICTVCNLMLDISTVYTVTHLDTVPPQLNRFLHQLFIASVIMVLFFNFLYVLILNRNQERLTKRTFGAVIAPLAVAAAVIIAGRLEFFASDKGAYSYGLMADMVYVCGLIYLVMTFGIIYSKKCTLSSYQKISVQVGMFIWLGSLIVQRIFPTVLLSGLGCVLMVLCVYFSFENQMRYDLVKMDKSIIWDAFGKGNEKSERLLASVIRLLKAINVKIVAEGVETKEMTDYLTEMGVDYLQGYYFSKPVNEDKFLEVISA